MKKCIVALCAMSLAFAAVACTNSDEDEPAATIATDLGADEFVLTGTVVDAKEGIEPSGGIPDAAADFETDEVGGLAIRPNEELDAEGLDGCSTTRDAFVTYYTPETDAGTLDDAAAWPDNLEGTRVRVEGTRHDRDEAAASTSPAASVAADVSGSCILVLDRIEQESAMSSPGPDDDTGTGAGTAGTGGASPGATNSPKVTAGGTPDFPEHEDTDPIFEGTPSPDPCEGQKACEQHRETGQEPQP